MNAVRLRLGFRPFVVAEGVAMLPSPGGGERTRAITPTDGERREVFSEYLRNSSSESVLSKKRNTKN